MLLKIYGVSKFLKNHRLTYYTFLLLICFSFVSCNQSSSSQIKAENEECEKNIKILKELEEENIVEVEKFIDELIASRENSSTDEDNETDNEAEEINFKQYYSNSVFMGDSLVEPLSLYGFLDTSSVVAKVGQNVFTALKSINTVANLNPKYIYLLYGLNDMSIYSNSKDFADNYKNLIVGLKDKLPNASIAIMSILPVEDKVSSKDNNFSKERQDKFNNELKNMCKELAINFVDITDLVTKELFEPDGIHMVAKFYPLWLEKIKDYREMQTMEDINE